MVGEEHRAQEEEEELNSSVGLLMTDPAPYPHPFRHSNPTTQFVRTIVSRIPADPHASVPSLLNSLFVPLAAAGCG